MTITKTEIRLQGLRFYAYHGVLPQERQVGGHYTVDATLQLTGADSAIHDDELSGTVNYAEAYAIISREMQTPSALIEHVAGRILRAVFAAFPLVCAATIEVRKDTPPMGADCAGCSVRLTATRD